MSENSEHEELKAWACRSHDAHARSEQTMNQDPACVGEPAEPMSLAMMANAIAAGTERALPNANPADLLEAMWLAMQLVGGPQKAAATLRYCGVNFVNT